MTGPSRSLPLAGIRVLDLSSVVMGPVCTQLLADYGADVVKIEPPEGDIMRHAGASCGPGLGAMFVHSNAGKRSVVMDLKNDVDRQRLHRAIGMFDVLVHNIRPAAACRLGVDEAAVRRLHPAIVHVELSGYGSGGPLAQRAAFDDIIQAQTGLADLIARQSGGEPMYVPALIADRLTGITAAHAVLAALLRRARDGVGESVKVSMYETMAALLLADHLGGASPEPPGGAMGYNRLLTRHRRPYRTKDGYIAVVIYNDRHWRSFFEAIGDAAAGADPRFASAQARAASYDFIYGYLARTMTSHTTARWLQLLEAADIPCSRVARMEELLDDPQLAASGLLQLGPPVDGIRQRRIAARYRAPIERHGASAADAPRLGEHPLDSLLPSRPRDNR